MYDMVDMYCHVGEIIPSCNVINIALAWYVHNEQSDLHFLYEIIAVRLDCHNFVQDDFHIHS
jgi:hypothetical protein